MRASLLRARRRLAALLLLALVPAPAAAAPRPLTSAERAALRAVPTDLLDKKPCAGTRLAATRTCRDAKHHVHTNEWFHHLFLPYIKGLGGAYVGVGSDQGLTFIAHARSRLAWMMDYDPDVVLINRLRRALILHSPTRRQYLARWEKSARAEVLALLAKVHRDPRRRAGTRRVYRAYRGLLRGYLRRMMRHGRRRPYHWLHREHSYRFVRQMFQRGRFRIIAGDLLKQRALRGIGRACRALRMPLRVLYLSNAEDYWRYTAPFRANIGAQLFDSRSVVLRTRTSRRGPVIGRYQYVVQSAEDFQRRIADRRYSGVWSMMRHRRPGKPRRPGFYVIGIGGRRSSRR